MERDDLVLPPAHRILVVGSVLMMALTAIGLALVTFRPPTCHANGDCGAVMSLVILVATRGAFIAGFIGVSSYWLSLSLRKTENASFQFRLFRVALPAALTANLLLLLG